MTTERTCEDGCNGCDECIDDDYDKPECERCCGKGWNWEDHQVAERKSDVQTLKIHCDKCEGTGHELV